MVALEMYNYWRNKILGPMPILDNACENEKIIIKKTEYKGRCNTNSYKKDNESILAQMWHEHLRPTDDYICPKCLITWSYACADLSRRLVCWGLEGRKHGSLQSPSYAEGSETAAGCFAMGRDEGKTIFSFFYIDVEKAHSVVYYTLKETKNMYVIRKNLLISTSLVHCNWSLSK